MIINHPSSVISHQSSITNHQSSIINDHQWSSMTINDHQRSSMIINDPQSPMIIDHPSSTINHQSPITNHQPSMIINDHQWSMINHHYHSSFWTNIVMSNFVCHLHPSDLMISPWEIRPWGPCAIASSRTNTRITCPSCWRLGKWWDRGGQKACCLGDYSFKML